VPDNGGLSQPAPSSDRDAGFAVGPPHATLIQTGIELLDARSARTAQKRRDGTGAESLAPPGTGHGPPNPNKRSLTCTINVASAVRYFVDDSHSPTGWTTPAFVVRD